jgi:hypothetical protein
MIMCEVRSFFDRFFESFLHGLAHGSASFESIKRPFRIAIARRLCPAVVAYDVVQVLLESVTVLFGFIESV